MNNKAIILLGNRQVGKDTAASAITTKYPFTTNVKFSKALKELAASVTGLPVSVFAEGDRDIPFTIPSPTLNWKLLATTLGITEIPLGYDDCLTPRDILIWLGTDVIRTHAGEGWHIHRTQEGLPVGKIPIFTDMRFENELDWVLETFDSVSVGLIHRNGFPVDCHELELSKVIHKLIVMGMFKMGGNKISISIFPNHKDIMYLQTNILDWFTKSLKETR